ncbi:PAS domain-containing sensor histidine kinase [Pelomonas sp. V22]|uniref:sensor histidine kinase n=1 Tax=Pelomonas sp. V22 TaxID=2822139 RepID=UPI0024A92BBF|nr:PAS domain-containing sensor histidine kinase [Pelomonas sp. V22]MDI4634156.1 PAS domain-containing sensor histidine kinase [Pelomonas sp. V22]
MPSSTEPSNLSYAYNSQEFRRFVAWIHGAVLAVAGLTLLGALLGGVREWPRYVHIGSILLLIGASQWRLRQRGPKASTVLLVVGLWLLASLNMWQYAGIYSSSLIVYPFLIGLAGWVLGSRWLVAVLLASIASVAVMGLGTLSGWHVPTDRASPLLVCMQLVSVLLITGGMVYVVNRTLLSSRNQAVRLSTELALRHAELLDQERELSKLVDAVPASVASFDSQSRVRRCNLRYAKLFGRLPAQVLGLHVEDFVPAEALEQIRPHWEQALRGQAGHYRRSNRDPVSGAVSWLDVSLIPDVEGTDVHGIFALLVDVTAQVEAEREVLALNKRLAERVVRRSSELAEANERLEQTQRELQEAQSRATLSVLVAKMSHELASPVGNSRLLADTFLHWIRDFETQLEEGQVRKSSLTRLLTDLRQGAVQLQQNLEGADALMRDFKQLSADQASGQRRRFELDELVREVLASMGPVLRRSGHEVKLELPAQLDMDSLPGPLGQVLINLINNALIHGLEGRSNGEISITATPSTDGQRVSLSVADNGRGIPAEALPELFKPFYSTRIGQGGSGLGLPIVEDIVCKRLGGSISVSSEPGQGSRFTLDLPLRLAAA